MDIIDNLNAVRTGEQSRRAFNKSLAAVGIGLVATPLVPKQSSAMGDHPTFFTWGGYDIPDLFGSYIEEHGEPPNFSVFGGSEEALTKMRGGFVVDASHPCNQALVRWTATGLFQPVDTSRLSNWPDVIPELVAMEGNQAPNGSPWMVPFDWGGTSVTYRTDLFDLEGEESWGMLWDKRHKGRLGSFASGADAWWCGAIYAGIDFNTMHTDYAFEKIGALMREQRPLIRTYTDDTTTLQQALASGEMTAAMTWNETAAALKAEGIPAKFADVKEGKLTWVCGVMIHKDAPNLDRTYEMIDSLLSVETGRFMINDYNYGHSNKRSFESFDDEFLASVDLSRNPSEILEKGNFQIPQTQEWESRMNETFELIKAGF